MHNAELLTSTIDFYIHFIYAILQYLFMILQREENSQAPAGKVKMYLLKHVKVVVSSFGITFHHISLTSPCCRAGNTPAWCWAASGRTPRTRRCGPAGKTRRTARPRRWHGVCNGPIRCQIMISQSEASPGRGAAV